MLTNIERGDTVVIRDASGATCSVEVLSVKQDYDTKGGFIRFDYINHAEPSPMRRTAYPKELLQIVKKNTRPVLDPKSPRPGDVKSGMPQKAIIIDGKTYVERTVDHSGAIPVTEGAGPQVHAAVKAPPTPVTSRIKQGKKPTPA